MHSHLVMFNITNNSNGLEPWGGLMFDDAGNLYGTTSSGGYAEDGTVFELSGTNYQTLTTLATFNTGNGSSPQAVLTADAAGNLYGTTTEGGVAYGTIFELTGTGFVVPEPGSLSLLAIGGLGLLNRRRRIA
jgi:uncharacterized repeat protein (TIGR03803 family)